MGAGVGGLLIKVNETPDVADLGDQPGRDGRTQPRDGLQPTGELGVKQFRDPFLGRRDLFAQQGVLLDQQTDLNGCLLVQLGRGDALPSQLWIRLARPVPTGRRPLVAPPGPVCSAGVELPLKPSAPAAALPGRCHRWDPQGFSQNDDLCGETDVQLSGWTPSRLDVGARPSSEAEIEIQRLGPAMER